MKRKLSIVAAAVTFLLVGSALLLRRPPMPAVWHQLHPGMSRLGVLSIVGSDTFDMRHHKGFETVMIETSMAGCAAYWQVFLRYDAFERLVSADARFVDRSCGLFSTSEKSVFR